jgi:hypothetical protein
MRCRKAFGGPAGGLGGVCANPAAVNMVNVEARTRSVIFRMLHGIKPTDEFGRVRRGLAHIGPAPTIPRDCEAARIPVD